MSLSSHWSLQPNREETIEKIRESRIGKYCGADHHQWKGVPDWIEKHQGKHFCRCGCGQPVTIKRWHHSEGIPEFILGHNKGERASNWRGGKSGLRKTIRNSSKYVEWKVAVLKKDNYTCQKCGQVRGTEAHHIKRLDLILKENMILSLKQAMGCKELWDVQNGLTLCKVCHNKTKGRISGGTTVS